MITFDFFAVSISALGLARAEAGVAQFDDITLIQMLSTEAQTITTIATTTAFVGTDHLGGLAVLTNEAGNPIAFTDYYPYGKIRTDEKVGSFESNRKYIGQYYDEETELSYLNARYYDGGVGRFLSKDPLVFALDYSFLPDPQQLNFYAYGRNNPMRYSDPSGKEVEELTNLLGGLSNAYLSNQLLGAGRVATDDPWAMLGQSFGDTLSIAQGVYQMMAGGGAMVGGGALCASGVGCLAGAPAIAGGAALMAHGASVVSSAMMGLSGNVGTVSMSKTNDGAPIPKPPISDPNLRKNYIDKLFKNSDKHIGGTAQAVRIELSTGSKVGGQNHLQKSFDYIKGLQRWLQNNLSASQADRNTATRVMNDLKDATKTLKKP